MSFFAYFSDALRLTNSAKNEAEIAAYSRNYLEGLRSSWQNLDNFKESANIKADNLPTGYKAKVTINETKGNVYNMAKEASEEVVSLRIISIVLTDETGEEFTMSTQIARPLGN